MPLRGRHTHANCVATSGRIGVDGANLPAGATWQIRASTGSRRQRQVEVAHPLDTGGSELGRAAIPGRTGRVRGAAEAGLVASHVRGQDRRIEAAVRAAAAISRHAPTVTGRDALADLDLRALACQAPVIVDDEAIRARGAASHGDARELAPTFGTGRTDILRTRRDRAGHAGTRVDARIAIRRRVGRAIAALRGRGRAIAIDPALRYVVAGTVQATALGRSILGRAGTTGGQEHDEQGGEAHVTIRRKARDVPSCN